MKVLVPIDGSQNALKAAEHAGHLAALEKDMQLTLLYVITFEPKSSREASYTETAIPNEAQAILHAAADTIHAEAPGISIEEKVIRGFSAADVILDCAELEKFDQIIMGTRGLSNVQRFLLGSVSTRVSQHSPCTVTLVK